MVLFGYEHGWGSVYPADDEVHRVMIFSDKKNNVLVWRGHDSNMMQHTLDQEQIWKIEDWLEEQKELSNAEKSGREYIYPLDVSRDDFFFTDFEGRLRTFSDMILSSEKGKDAVIDKVIVLISKIQTLLQENDINVTMLCEDD